MIKFFAFILLLVSGVVNSQVNFRLIAPEGKLKANEKFQVLFVWNVDEVGSEFIAPTFSGCKILSGPTRNITKGNGSNASDLHSVTYLLQAGLGETIHIASATLKLQNETYHTRPCLLSTNELSAIASMNKNSAELQGFLQKGLFVRLEVDKKVCMQGEAITATYKLYSAVEVKSEIVKSPSFLGCSVVEVKGSDYNLPEFKTIDNKQYEVYVLRRVQLYPLQAGTILLDNMVLQNQIKLEDPYLGIVKGDTVSLTLSSPTESVQVNPLPIADGLVGFQNGVGRWTMQASWKKKTVHVNEISSLMLSLVGEGNFMQISPPDIQWPPSVDELGRNVVDSISEGNVPLKGRKSVVYAFSAKAIGKIVVPPILFSYYDTYTHTIKTLRLALPPLEVLPPVKSFGSKQKVNRSKSESSFLYYCAALLLGALAVFVLVKRRFRRPKSIYAPPMAEGIPFTPLESIPTTDGQFYTSLKAALLHNVSIVLGLENHVSVSKITDALLSNNYGEMVLEQWNSIIAQCDHQIYTGQEDAFAANVLRENAIQFQDKIVAFKSKQEFKK